MYRYISRESCSQFDSLPLTSLTSSTSSQRALARQIMASCRPARCVRRGCSAASRLSHRFWRSSKRSTQASVVFSKTRKRSFSTTTRSSRISTLPVFSSLRRGRRKGTDSTLRSCASPVTRWTSCSPRENIQAAAAVAPAASAAVAAAAAAAEVAGSPY